MSQQQEQSNNKKEKKWFPLESNPEVMNKYLERLGVNMEKSSLEFVDVYGLDDELLSMVPQPAVAVLLVYPINEAAEEYNVEMTEKTQKLYNIAAANNTKSDVEDDENDKKKTTTTVAPGSPAWFCAQTISNACGTIAILHAIGNNLRFFPTSTTATENNNTASDETNDNADDGVLLRDGFINKFLSSTKNMSPDQRAKYLEGDDDLDEAQAVSASEGQTTTGSIDDDVNLHFVCFTRSADGFLVELDGRKSFPIPHGPCEKPEDLLPAAANAIKKFIELAGESALANLAITALAGKM